MPYVPFYMEFPELAKKETRAMILFDDPIIPDGKYYLIESYCDEPGCDCRRVFLNVLSDTDEPLAVIAYGWENKKFYSKWLGGNDPEAIKDLKGPSLNLCSPQSKYAPTLLEKVEFVLQDKQYLNRLKRHYKLFRDFVDKKYIKNNNSTNQLETIQSNSKLKLNVGRNDPCPCGSGKKYKKCCML